MALRRRLVLALLMLVVSGLVLAAAGCGGDDGGEEATPTTEAPATEAPETEAPTTEPEATTEAPPETEAPATGDPIVIGSTLPLSGPLATLGGLVNEGIAAAVADVNAAGGIDLGGTKHELVHEVLDNQSDPNLATQQARTLVEEKGAIALLGSFTAPLSIPISNVAEQLQVPAIFTNTPVQAWLAANPEGWSFAWDMFVDENQQTQLVYEAADRAETNKKVALFTDTEDDGVVMGALWEQFAPEWGYEVVYRANFPVGTTDYKSFIEEAKAAEAEVLVANMIPPDGLALWNQMKALGYAPKVAQCEKCAHFAGWPIELGELGEGTLMFGWWDPAEANPGTDRMLELFGEKYGQTTELETTVTNYAVATVLFDAMTRAASADPVAINEALAATDFASVVGQVTFESNAYVIPAFERQWQGSEQVRVTPADHPAVAPFVAPLPGF